MIYGFSSEADYRKAADCAKLVGVTLMRTGDLSTADNTAALTSDVLYCAKQGVKLILQYNMADSTLGNYPLNNLVAHIASIGPNGTLWTGGNAGLKPLAPTHIEIGNEWSFGYRGDRATAAANVANTVVRFYNAVGPTLGANAMKFICEGEDANKNDDLFMNTLFSTVSNINTYLDGWVVHGYGPPTEYPGYDGIHGSGYDNHARLNARLNARGLTTDKIWITENGITTDGGPRLDNNYGFKQDMTYSEAATEWLAHVRRFGNSLSFSSRIYCCLQFQGFDQFVSGTNTVGERYFGVFQNDGTTHKGNFTTASATLASEFPASTPSGTTYAKAGRIASGARSSGADAYTASETGSVRSGSRESGTRGTTTATAGLVLSGARASGVGTHTQAPLPSGSFVAGPGRLSSGAFSVGSKRQQDGSF